jgi:hypothetical protein
MQERYFGGVGDFAKYGLLRALVSALPAAQLGVHWYLTDDQLGNPGDGKHDAYLLRATNRALDPILFDLLKEARGAGRETAAIEEGNLLPGVFVREPVPDLKNRSEWSDRAKAQLGKANLAFVDPDNGLETRSPNRKHILRREISDLLDVEFPRSLIVYQHRARQRMEEDMCFPRTHIAECTAHTPLYERFALVVRRGTQRAFIVLAHPEHADHLLNAATSFVAKWAIGSKEMRIFEPNLVR